LTNTLTKPRAATSHAWTDTELVHKCLEGEEEAWNALVDKYKRLIYSVPVKYGFSPDEAGDVFQSVCLELLTELPKLREPRALPKWILQVTSHKCFHRKRQQLRTKSQDLEEIEPPADHRVVPVDQVIWQTQQEQSLRDAMALLPPRCREMIQMLFFETPSRAYLDVAKSLGIAIGSIGFIRQRCLDKLRRELEKTGFA